MHTDTYRRLLRSLPWAAALLLLWAAAPAFAQDGAEADPPGRVAHMSVREGGVVFAPQGEDEWIELPQNRPLTRGDRLWTDRGARAELHLGTAVLHLGDESHLGFSQLDDRNAQLLLQQGSLNARVRDLAPDENLEIGTPNLAFRAQQTGDYRIDVAPDGSQTRVIVRSGQATVFGEGGESLQLRAGQQAAFAGRALALAQLPASGQDDFDAWAAERNRAEDQAIASRYVPRGVVGATQLDAYGTWSQDPGLGAVWYPQVTVQDWAPYRYGRWEWISPWGWTWIDDAPWGFAPFHYGRWTMIADRWAWVPGRMAARPVYAPALVVFLGGGPSVGWYPLAPGEAWWPTYRSSTRYVNFANFNIDLNRYPRHYAGHLWRQRPHAITAVREDDFRRGRPVYRHRQALRPDALGGTRIGAVPARPEWRRERDRDGDRGARTTRLQAAPPAAVQPGAPRFWGGREGGNREFDRREADRRDSTRRDPDRRDFGGRELPPAVRDQARAQREQERLQRDAEREARRQQREAERGQRQNELRLQRDQQLRQQQDVFRQQQEAVRQQQEAIRQQQALRGQQERARRDAQERFEANPPRQRDRDGWQRGQGQVRPMEPQRRFEPQQAPRERRGGEAAREARGEGRGEGRRQREGGEGRGLQYQR